MNSKLTITKELQTALNLGDYTIVAHQNVTIGGATEKLELTRHFLVAGPRFVLEPREIVGVFPPPYTNGDYNNFLPYITITRSTLPWERQIAAHMDDPFLALLVLSEQDLAAGIHVKTVKIAEFCAGRPEMQPEPSDDPDVYINVVEADGKQLADVLPRRDDLALLAHVRQRDEGLREAVILSNRRPLPNARYVVHLVSLEGMNPANLTKGTVVQLPSLYRWEFTCGTDKIGLVERLRELDCDGLRLPDRASGSAEFRAVRRDGYAALPYRLAWGDRAYGLYRGPLLPVAVSEPLEATFTRVAGLSSGEGLVDYLGNLGLADVSLAAAWELGRMLMLRNRDVAMSYYRFRREQSVIVTQIENAGTEQHLAFGDVPPQLADLPPENVVAFCRGLVDLRGIPFGYLVPDPRMMPEKSLRAFRVDRRWLGCMLAGALSPGRARTVDQAREAVYLRNLMADVHERSGVLMRSPVVPERPNQTYVFKSSSSAVLPIRRRDVLASDVCLFIVDGVFQSIEASEQPKAAHFGFKEAGGGGPEFFEKDLRNPNTFEELPQSTVQVTQYRDIDRGVLDMVALATAFATKNNVVKGQSHHFALQLIESGAGAMTIALGGTST